MQRRHRPEWYVLACGKVEDLGRWECRAAVEQLPIRAGYYVSNRNGVYSKVGEQYISDHIGLV